MTSVPILSGTHARLVEEGLRTVWGLDLARYDAEWVNVFEKNSSDKAYEDEYQMYGLGVAPRKYEAENIVYDSGGQGFTYRYTNLEYAIGVAISRIALEDNKYLDLSTAYTKEIAKALMETQEILGANILNRAFTNTYTGSDGKELCSTAHVHPTGDTYSNNLATPAAISETSLEDMLIQMRTLLDARGLPVRLNASRLIIPPALQHKAYRILMSPQQNNTANNALNAIKGQGLIPSTQVLTRLTSTTAFWIQTDAQQGLKMFERVAPSYDTTIDFDSFNFKLKGRMRTSFGWTNPMAVIGNSGA